jgi:hypothetical protein
MQVFGSGTDTINGVATATGVAQAAGKTGIYVATTTGAAASGSACSAPNPSTLGHSRPKDPAGGEASLRKGSPRCLLSPTAPAATSPTGCKRPPAPACPARPASRSTPAFPTASARSRAASSPAPCRPPRPQIGLTAAADGLKADATALTGYGVNSVTTVAGAADSVLAPYAYPGAVCVINNDGANALQVFGKGTDTDRRRGDRARSTEDASCVAGKPKHGKYEVVGYEREPIRAQA